jgi:hypothetical protein
MRISTFGRAASLRRRRRSLASRSSSFSPSENQTETRVGDWSPPLTITLVRPDRLDTKAASDAADVRWFAADALPTLAFYHAQIIATARRRLRARLDESADAFGFLPKTFTLEQLRLVDEIVGGERLDPRQFRRRVLALELVEETGKPQAATHRPARLFRASRRKSS